MRNVPYGAGTVIYQPRNTCSPYTARRYKGRNENGSPTYLYMGSYPTEAQAEYVLKQNASLTVTDLEYKNYTFREVFEVFVATNPQYAKKTMQFYQRAFVLCKPYHDLSYAEIKCKDMMRMLDRCDTYNKKVYVHHLFTRMDRTAKQLGVMTRGEAQFLPPLRALPGEIKRRPPRVAFTDAEVDLFRQHRDEPYMNIVLVLCYTGLRQGELRTLKKEKVYLDKGYMVAGFKTEAGTNRVIPIHPEIKPIVERWMDIPGEYLLPNEEGGPMSGRLLLREFKKVIAPYTSGPHVAHETRHTFITKLAREGVDDNIIRKLAGHCIPDVMTRIYFHPTLEQLRDGVMHLW